MTADDLIQLEIEIQASEADEGELDSMTRNLLAELRKTDVESVNLVSAGDAPDGAKGDPINIGQIILETLPSTLPGIIALVQAWTSRGQGRFVKYKGNGIEFEGSPEELQKILNKLQKGNKKK